MKFIAMGSTTLFASLLALATMAQPQPARSDPGHGHGHAHGAQGFSAGQPGNAKKPARTVQVTMRETADGKMIYEPNKLTVKRGEQVRFVLINAGEVPHEFVLASRADNRKHAAEMAKNPDMKHEEPNGRMLEPKAKAEILWQFSKAGTFEFACLIPGHLEAGMIGTVTVR